MKLLRRIYLVLKASAAPALAVFFLTAGLNAAAQQKDTAAPKNLLLYYNSSAQKQNKPARTYTKLNYTRPTNQLMSWPNYPLTAAQIEQRDRNWKQEHKLSSVVAKDIITSFLSKKKRTAVQPKF